MHQRPALMRNLFILIGGREALSSESSLSQCSFFLLTPHPCFIFMITQIPCIYIASSSTSAKSKSLPWPDSGSPRSSCDVAKSHPPITVNLRSFFSDWGSHFGSKTLSTSPNSLPWTNEDRTTWNSRIWQYLELNDTDESSRSYYLVNHSTHFTFWFGPIPIHLLNILPVIPTSHLSASAHLFF
jgi:hypothetical protein